MDDTIRRSLDFGPRITQIDTNSPEGFLPNHFIGVDSRDSRATQDSLDEVVIRDGFLYIT